MAAIFYRAPPTVSRDWHENSLVCHAGSVVAMKDRHRSHRCDRGGSATPNGAPGASLDVNHFLFRPLRLASLRRASFERLASRARRGADPADRLGRGRDGRRGGRCRASCSRLPSARAGGEVIGNLADVGESLPVTARLLFPSIRAGLVGLCQGTMESPLSLPACGLLHTPDVVEVNLGLLRRHESPGARRIFIRREILALPSEFMTDSRVAGKGLE